MPSSDIKGAPPDKNAARKALALRLLGEALDAAERGRLSGSVTVEVQIQNGSVHRPERNIRTFHEAEP